MRPDHWLPMDQQLHKDAQDNHSIDQPQEERWHHPVKPAPRTYRAAPQSACGEGPWSSLGCRAPAWPLDYLWAANKTASLFTVSQCSR